MAKMLKQLRIGPDAKENDLHGTPDYPCEVYYTDLSKHKAGLLPEHWHNELEYGLVTKGKIILKCNGQENLVEEGQGFFINTNVLHSMQAKEKEACYYSAVFHEKFLGLPERLQDRYVYPIVEDATYSFAILKENELVEMLQRAMQCYEDKKEEFEYDFYQMLCAIWKRMYQMYPPATGIEEKVNQRIQKMLQFIAEHYWEDIGVEEIAARAGISKRECFRSFKNHLNSSPNIYLTQFRMNRAAEQIILTDKTMAEIARDCGFSSATYFSTKFLAVYGMSPKEYRICNQQ